MKNIIRFRTVITSLAIVSCMIAFGAEAHATTNILAAATLDPVSIPTTISATPSVRDRTVSLYGSVSAPSVSSTWTVLVNWGDGSVASTVPVYPGRTSQSGDWYSSHTYASSGIYTVKASLMNASVVLATTTTSATINSPAPALTSISPVSKVSGGAAFPLTLTGSNFGTNSIVKWNGVSKITHYISSTKITADILASDIATAGAPAIAAFTPLPGGGTSASKTFTVTAAPTPIPNTTKLTGNPSAFSGGATAGCTPHLSTDWIDATDWSARLLTPTDCAIVKITTPVFSWKQVYGRNLSIPWNFTLRNASNVVIFTATSSSPRIFLDDYPLAPGTYSWQVNYTNTAGVVQTSVWRTFSIAPDAITFKLPSGETYAAMAKAKPSPRMLPTGSTFAGIVASANAGELKNPYSGFLWLANKLLPSAMPSAPAMKVETDFPSKLEYTAWLMKITHLVGDEHQAINYIAYAGKFTGDPKYNTAALARIMSLAIWPTTGPTSEAINDQANREIYVALAEGLDLLGSKMTTAQRATVIAAIRDRVGQTMATIINLDYQPYNSHLLEVNRAAVQALTLTVGVENFPEAQQWLARSWEAWLTTAAVWGGADGSWGNSGAYGWFAMIRMTELLAEVRLVTGIDLTKWPVFGKYGDTQIAQYAPIYSPVTALLRGSFGDGVEDANFYRAYSNTTYRLFAKLTGKPSDEWYWRVGTTAVPTGNAIQATNFLMLGLGLPVVTPAAPTKNSYAFEDSGIAALHTSTADPLRTSLFFRSSRLGSLNHSHADSNAFTFVSKGKEILISGGYYPYFASPHHLQVGRATRYKNALTFDGGIGQSEPTSAPTAPGAPEFSAEARGQLINYFDNGIWSAVTGDATLAYRGLNTVSKIWTPLLTEADRTVVFNRVEKVAIIYDYATSATSRQWELNYHTMLNSPFIVSGGTIEINNAPGKACIDHYGLPGSFTQTTAFDVAPETALPNQNHGRYTATTKSNVLTSVTVIREDCRILPVNVTFSGSSASVSLNNASPITFDKKTVQVPII